MDSKNKWWERFPFGKKAEVVEIKKQPVADTSRSIGTGNYTTLFAVSYNGEKNLGEIGPIKNYRPDYAALRIRSWQSYLESEVTQTVINKFTTWVIGKGLKLQSEPSELILKSEKIELDVHEFSELVEARFNVFRKSKCADYGEMRSLDKLAKIAYNNSIIGGDVLVILRYDKNVTIQLVDGAHVQSPVFGTEYYPTILANGNRIINGIEVDPKGKHIRYYVRTENNKFETVEARGKESGLQMAFLVYGMEYRLDNVRGIPLISTILETLKKLERYKEATLGSAEERQKIALSIEHDNTSTGENPFIGNMAKAFDNSQTNDLPKDVSGVELANTVAATTNKQAINMPPGAKLHSLESKNELYFKDFYSVNIDLVCAAIQIPPNVAMSKYDSNFSASRAALKEWEHTLGVKRQEFSEMFYQPIYNFWLEIEILRKKIDAPGYLLARLEGNDFMLEVYRTARFVGSNVPHIDPVKEVTAERLKLGQTGIDLPLTTAEAATEAVNGGDSDTNFRQYSEELKQSKTLGIEKIVPVAKATTATED